MTAANSTGCSHALMWSPSSSRISAPSALRQDALLSRLDQAIAGRDQRCRRYMQFADPRPGVVATQRLPGLHDADRIVAAHLAAEPRHVDLHRMIRSEQPADAVRQPALVCDRAKQRTDDPQRSSIAHDRGQMNTIPVPLPPPRSRARDGGCRRASSMPTGPPIEYPTAITGSTPRASSNAAASSATSSSSKRDGSRRPRPWPR